MGSGNPPSQTNALNKDILAQGGLLGAILLNNQHLIRAERSTSDPPGQQRPYLLAKITSWRQLGPWLWKAYSARRVL